MSQLLHEKRTRSQHTIDQVQQNLDQSPLKLARTATRSKHGGRDGQLRSASESSKGTFKEASNNEEEDELLLQGSPSKPKAPKSVPRFLSPAKRPPSPFEGSSRTPSEEREAKRTKRGPDPEQHVFGQSRVVSLPIVGSPVRAESATPESPKRPSSSQIQLNETSCAQSVPFFPESPYKPDSVLGYSKDGLPVINLAHPSLSPSRHRSVSPEKGLKILPPKTVRNEAFADNEASNHPIQPIAFIPEQMAPLTPPLPVATLPKTPQPKATILDLGSPLTPVPETPWPKSKEELRKQLLQEAMAKDMADMEERLATTPKAEVNPPTAKRKPHKTPPKTPTNKGSFRTQTKLSSLSRLPASGSTSSESLKKRSNDLMMKKPLGGAAPNRLLKQRKALTTSSTLTAGRIRKSITGKASTYYPRADKRSLLGLAAKTAAKLSMKGQMKPKMKEAPKPVPKVHADTTGSLDTLHKSQPEDTPMATPTLDANGEGKDSEEKSGGIGYNTDSTLTPVPTDSELTDLSSSGVSSPSNPTTNLPKEYLASQTPRANLQPAVTTPDEMTPKARPPKVKSLPKKVQKPSKPSTSQSRITRSSSLCKKPEVEGSLGAAIPSFKPSSAPDKAAKHPFDTVDAANELIRMASASVPPRSPVKEAMSPTKLKRQSSTLSEQPPSRFTGKNGEPSALDNLNRALAKLKVPPPSRPTSSAGSSCSKLGDDTKSDSSKGESSSGATKQPSAISMNPRESSVGPRFSNAASSSSKSNGKIDVYLKPKPFLPAGSGTGKGKIPRNSIAPSVHRPKGFGPKIPRANKVSRQPALPSVLASPVKGGGGDVDYIDYEVNLPDESMDVEEISQLPDAKGKGKEVEFPDRAPINVMGPPDLPLSSKTEPESPISDQSSKSQKARRKTDEFPTVSSDSAEILSGCVAFVDVRTESGDGAGEVFAEMLQSMGARVLKAVGQTCTHIIYKNGLASTLNRLRSLPEPKPKLVSLAWVAECAEQGAHIDEEGYLLDLADIELGGIIKRRRSILPKIFAQDQEDSKPIDLSTTLNAGDEDTRPPSRTKRRNRPS